MQLRVPAKWLRDQKAPEPGLSKLDLVLMRSVVGGKKGILKNNKLFVKIKSYIKKK